MNRKVKLALAAFLGFSAACSTVKQAPQVAKEPAAEETPQPRDADTAVVQEQPGRPRIVLMYGVRPPVSDSMRTKRLEQQRPDSLPPVAEQPVEEDPAAE